MQHQVLIHAPKNFSSLFLNKGVIPTIIVYGPFDIHETTHDVGTQNPRIYHTDSIHDVGHGQPSVKGANNRIDCLVIECGIGQISSIVIERLIQIQNRISLTKSFDKKGVIGPAGTRILNKTDAALLQETPTING